MSGRPLAYEELERERPPAPTALPPLCVRRLQTHCRYGCEMHCPGQQPDGGCLVDVVQEHGGDCVFEIDKDGYWCLVER